MVKILQEQTKTEKVVVGVECGRCHRVYHDADKMVDKNGQGVITDQRDMWEISEMHHIDFTGGYGSIFGDGNSVRCDLCQHCLRDLIRPFARIEDPYLVDNNDDSQ